LEEYYVGGLFLEVCNGVSDGTFVYLSMYLVAAVWGNDIYLNQVQINSTHSYPVGILVLYFIFGVQILTVMGK
jgi:hypothetical protein